ncbi:hypothetical protein TNCV_2568571 [Trichonephila clavipes]|uniref:Uncharacterized protein n=1 Tax=Trichonephila clavipes TaxID=2585209 RepID=A0A8X6WLG5_TRICX|nr:hypothetical protein TNCV_2568571 [Trichonephila clavipes]
MSTFKFLEPLTSKPRTNALSNPEESISAPDVSKSSSSTQAQLLPSTSSIATSITQSFNHLFLHLMMHLPTMICSPVLNHHPQSYPLPHPSPLLNHALILIQYRMPRKYQKLEQGKEKKNTEKKRMTQ